MLLIVSGLLLFRPADHALCDGEANMAIFAHDVWKFDDTDAWDATNIIAFHSGLELSGIKNRVFLLGQYSFAASFLGLLGRAAFSARLKWVRRS
jgi:hypothetical protein